MNSELVWVLCLLAGAIYLFMTNKVRMDAGQDHTIGRVGIQFDQFNLRIDQNC